jgi:hypothetical protein
MRLVSFNPRYGDVPLIYVNPELVTAVQANPEEPERSTCIWMVGSDAEEYTCVAHRVEFVIEALQKGEC